MCLFLNCGDHEEVLEKHIMAAHLVQLLQIVILLAAGVDMSEKQQLVEAVSL